jgi:RNA polymerase sigma-70 factor (ECF subfamily)
VDPDTLIGGPDNQFPSTQVSLLEATAGGMSNEAAGRIAALYWKPVYRFIRLKFHKNNEDAKDLTQGFFVMALERDFFERFNPAKGSFRSYVRMAVERFAINQYAAAKRQKRGGDVEFVCVEEPAIATESPEQAFEREWQRQLFCLALDDLRAHCDESGKQILYRVLEEYDLTEGQRPSYAEIARQYGISESCVTNYLAWARRMLRGFVNERLRGTTSGVREMREEMRRLWT